MRRVLKVLVRIIEIGNVAAVEAAAAYALLGGAVRKERRGGEARGIRSPSAVAHLPPLQPARGIAGAAL